MNISDADITGSCSGEMMCAILKASSLIGDEKGVWESLVVSGRGSPDEQFTAALRTALGLPVNAPRDAVNAKQTEFISSLLEEGFRGIGARKAMAMQKKLEDFRKTAVIVSGVAATAAKVVSHIYEIKNMAAMASEARRSRNIALSDI